MTKNTLAISEMFFSLQGEGQTQGCKAFFIRLGGCNLDCGARKEFATWVCDTTEVWKKSEKMTFDEVYDELERKYDFKARLFEGAHLVFTGGEPLLHQKSIVDFIWFLYRKKSIKSPIIEIETNGTIISTQNISFYTSYFNISPKLKNSGEPLEKRLKPEVLRELNKISTTIFKFVISKKEDWLEIYNDFIFPKLVSREKIWLMPAADNKDDLDTVSKMVADLCIRQNVNFSNRLHIQLWNQTTGV